MDKKKRDQRVTIIPGEENSQGFKVVSVIQDPIDYKANEQPSVPGGGQAQAGQGS